MILKRPSGKIAEDPAALRQRLDRSWDTRVSRALEGSTDGDDAEGDFPLVVAIGAPNLTGDALVRNRAEIQSWIDSWKGVDPSFPVLFEGQVKRRVGEVRLPIHITFEDIDALARFLGPGHVRDLGIARGRIATLASVDRRLRGLARHWRRIAAFSETETKGLGELVEARRDGHGELIDIRELAVVGLDTKWIERSKTIVRDALAHIDRLTEGATYREQFGFREDDRQELWLKVHPDDMTGPFGSQEFAVRPSQATDLPASIKRIAIVENKATFHSHAPLPGTCLFFGSGNFISGVVCAMPALADREIRYWGDLDSFGMKILSRVRRALPQTVSFCMDAGTMQAHAHLWTDEVEEDRFTGNIEGITHEEEAALALIRSGCNRLEQERIRPDETALKALGVTRRT